MLLPLMIVGIRQPVGFQLGAQATRFAPTDLAPARYAADVGERRNVSPQLGIGMDDRTASDSHTGHDAGHHTDERHLFDDDGRFHDVLLVVRGDVGHADELPRIGRQLDRVGRAVDMCVGRDGDHVMDFNVAAPRNVHPPVQVNVVPDFDRTVLSVVPLTGGEADMRINVASRSDGD